MTDTHLSEDLRVTLRATGVGVWSFDVASGRFEMDQTCRELIDLLPWEELSPATMGRRIHPEDLARYLAEIRQVMGGEERVVEYRIVRRDGSIRHICSRGRLSQRPPGEPPLLTGICLDITRQRALEDELRATQDRMQNLADHVPGLFAYLDRNYVIRFLSAQYDEWYGTDRTCKLGCHISEVIDPESWAKRRPLYDRVMAGEVISYEESRRMASGEERYYQVTYRPARGPGGAINGILSLAIDISGRRRAELALEEKSAELARSNLDLEQFAYVASHDLKAPLRSIDILVDWLQDDLREFQQGEVQANLTLLKQRTGRLHRLLDDLLAYSRAGRKPGTIASVDTRLLVQDLITLLAPPDGIRVEADASLPTFTAHHAPLEQVLRNLINNAIKHHPGGSGLVRVYAQDQGEQVLFAVEDDGAGIPPEFAERVFQMFQTLRPRDEVEGSGMGLAIVKRIVEWQGGRVGLHGGPGGRGAVFKFTWRKLPAGAAGEPPGDEVSDEQHEDRAYLAG